MQRRAGGDAGPGEGDAEDLQQLLRGAVLAAGPCMATKATSGGSAAAA